MNALVSTGALRVDDYAVTPEEAAGLGFQIQKVRDTGLTGQLSNIRWDTEAAAMEALLRHDGIELRLTSSEYAFTVEPIHTKPIEATHDAHTRQGPPVCVRRITAEHLEDAIKTSLDFSYIGYAWAAGKVRSTDSIRFELPLTAGLYGGRVRTQTDVVTNNAELVLTLTDDELQVLAYGGEGPAEDQLSAILEQIGATREDLIASMKACRDVSTARTR